MSIVRRVGPVLDQAIAAILNRADHGDIVSIKAALNHIRHSAPDLVASNDELIEAIIEAATALGLTVASDADE
ncbi:hypothetical protein EOC93_22335 [Mesorhizobium sp. M6A.T.Ce.TU.002.03.1.1]|uniref:Uncharacterized protein n=1 Tax=Mesorhizobium delmotii TaxID=1631247 RepID=A0A2P9AS73_9HYPH|nr:MULTISPECIES: hypothetical protein [Mesorhizobium]RUU39367.1 hypothetical protein EOC93_22335 [Mesorhizobium sp. M6A.T.Ce.TU.002.03.1.1]RWQ64478.1 MAG: hypothetical protein EOS86_19530 [Mesorhizobium sp.]SJM34009.1 conserved hypothetical protein [Mesorhizobium delmotii]